MNNVENNNPLISIIVPVYNAEKYLRECISSILAQTYENIEIILVNDGSPDGSRDICIEFLNKHPDRIVFLDGPNGGVSVARNKGLAAARGEWITFCDSDDTYYPEHCEFLLRQAQSTGAQFSSASLIREGADAPSSNIPLEKDVVWDREDILRHFIHPYLRLGDPVSLKVLGYMVVSIFRKDIIQEHKIAFRPGMKMGEDEAFLFEYVQYVERMALSRKVIYFYRANEESAVYKYARRRRFQYSKRAVFWLHRAQERLRVFKAHNLQRIFPEAYPIIWLQEKYHEVQSIDCDRERSFFRKVKDISAVLKEMKAAPEYKLCYKVQQKKNKFFFNLCRLGLLPVIFYCKSIQLKNIFFPA